MPALRLKTKLVIAITGMVVAIVVALLAAYLYEVVQVHIAKVKEEGALTASEIFSGARTALKTNLKDFTGDPNDPAQAEAAFAKILQNDPGFNALVNSTVTYLKIVEYAAVTSKDGRALVHTFPSSQGQILPRQEDFSSIAEGGIWKQLKFIYAKPRVYEFRVAFLANNVPFEVRVGVSNVFIKDQLRPIIRRALIYSGSCVLLSLILAAGVSNFALRPLAAISRRLDMISSGQLESTEAAARRSDEYGAVSTKIDRLGRQMRDVKEVFSALKENLDQMMGNLQDGVMLFTSDYRAVLVSASAERFIGKPRGDMLGLRPTEIFAEESRLDRAILDAFAAHRGIEQEEIEVENGHRVQIALDFIEERGERIGALLTLRDAESVRRIEDEIELSRRLAAIGRLTSGVAHEVKNPINAIVVHLEVLRQKLSQVDPDTRRHMDVIGAEIKRLDRVVQTLVDFTRPVDLRLLDMDLRKLVEDVVTLASPEAGRQRVSIERNLGPEPLLVRVDADLIKQALLNIVINGVQAMSESGGILTIMAQREGEGGLISVRDQGPGIPAEVRDKIYNLYFTTKKGGSGIGLSMAYRVLQLHHGSLEFESVEGQGATFILRIPLAEGAAGEQRASTAADSVRMA